MLLRPWVFDRGMCETQGDVFLLGAIPPPQFDELEIQIRLACTAFASTDDSNSDIPAQAPPPSTRSDVASGSTLQARRAFGHASSSSVVATGDDDRGRWSRAGQPGWYPLFKLKRTHDPGFLRYSTRAIRLAGAGHPRVEFDWNGTAAFESDVASGSTAGKLQARRAFGHGDSDARKLWLGRRATSDQRRGISMEGVGSDIVVIVTGGSVSLFKRTHDPGFCGTSSPQIDELELDIPESNSIGMYHGLNLAPTTTQTQKQAQAAHVIHILSPPSTCLRD
ncbi:hypothetical protein C8F01DRAFT_1262355 [Mycena amicta]|nr:hypothetical protein C8F01DRAFT_1262355 [Mycena amicta]